MSYKKNKIEMNPFVSRRDFLMRSAGALAAMSAAGLVGCAGRAAGVDGGVALANSSPPSLVLSTVQAPSGMLRAPDLRDARVIGRLAGVRPYRRGGVRVELETLAGKTVVHNYGHGGSGITLSWGTSLAAADLLRENGSKPSAVAVLGGGAVGLASAVVLLERGWDVTVYADRFSPETTSNIAAAQFAPSLVDGIDSERMERWVRASAERFLARRGDEHGIRERPNYATGNGGSGLRHLPDDLFEVSELDRLPIAGCNHSGWVRQTMLIETPIYMPRLMREVYTLGGRTERKRFNTPDDIAELTQPVIVNCLGLGAGTLLDDRAVIPMRGQLVLLAPQDLPYMLSHSGGYMFPRADAVILGGTVERGNASMQPDADDCLRILDRHRDFYRG